MVRFQTMIPFKINIKEVPKLHINESFSEIRNMVYHSHYESNPYLFPVVQLFQKVKYPRFGSIDNMGIAFIFILFLLIIHQ